MTVYRPSRSHTAMGEGSFTLTMLGIHLVPIHTSQRKLYEMSQMQNPVFHHHSVGKEKCIFIGAYSYCYTSCILWIAM